MPHEHRNKTSRMTYIVLHNPNCSTSRNGLALLDEKGVFARPPSNKRLTSAVLSLPVLGEALSTGSVLRCPDKVSFLTGHSYQAWAEAWRKVQANKFAVSVEGHPEAGGEMLFVH